MAVWKKDKYKAPMGALWNEQGSKYGRGQFARELFTGRYQPGELLRLSNIVATYEIDEDALLNIFSECQSLGLLTLSNKKLQRCVRQIPKRCRRLTKYAPVWKKSAGEPQRLCSKGTPGDCGMS